MDDDKRWFAFCAVWTLGMLGVLLWRGEFRMPLHGSIRRSDDPLSFWVIFAFLALFPVAFGGFALFGH